MSLSRRRKARTCTVLEALLASDYKDAYSHGFGHADRTAELRFGMLAKFAEQVIVTRFNPNGKMDTTVHVIGIAQAIENRRVRAVNRGSRAC